MQPQFITRSCPHCGSDFSVRPSRLKHGRGMYCGRACRANAYVLRRWGALETRIRSQIIERGPDECWPWTGNDDGHGYGTISTGCRPTRVTRILWELANGPLAPGQVIRHTCDNPPCCNLRHFVPGTKAQNSRDMRERERSARGERNGATRLTDIQVREMLAAHRAGTRQIDLARRYGVAPQTVNNIVRRRSWLHISP